MRLVVKFINNYNAHKSCPDGDSETNRDVRLLRQYNFRQTSGIILHTNSYKRSHFTKLELKMSPTCLCGDVVVDSKWVRHVSSLDIEYSLITRLTTLSYLRQNKVVE